MQIRKYLDILKQQFLEILQPEQLVITETNLF